MKREEMQVAALRNGTVIDHIPTDKVFDVVSLLGLDKIDSAVTIGNHLKSFQMGSKGIIKIADKFFTDAELNQISVIAPNVTLCEIRDYEVSNKKSVVMPDSLVGIVKCSNPKCISNNEPMNTRFECVDKENGILKCHYCNHEVKVGNIELV